MTWTLAVGHRLEVTAYMSNAEQVGVNVLLYTVEAVTGVPDAELMADAISTRFATPYINWISDDCVYAGVKVRGLNVPLGPAPVFSDTGANGGNGGAGLPRQLTGLLRKRANLQGPKGRGRTYLPFPGATSINGDALSAAGLTLAELIRTAIWNTPGGFILTLAGGATVTLMLRIGTSALLQGTQIDVMTASTQFATQRRRGSFGRPNTLPSELT